MAAPFQVVRRPRAKQRSLWYTELALCRILSGLRGRPYEFQDLDESIAKSESQKLKLKFSRCSPFLNALLLLPE
jgi:hypothetical protein